MKKLKESFFYYISCMLCLNFLLFIRLFPSHLFSNNRIKNLGNEISSQPFKFAYFIILGVSIIIGVICTVIILTRDDSRKKNELGKEIKCIEVIDITADSYFTYFSLFVLTALSLSIDNEIKSIIIYVIINTLIFIIYTKCKMIYINPILSLFQYKCYNIRDDKNGYILLTRSNEIRNNQIIVCSNTSSKIIRLKTIELK